MDTSPQRTLSPASLSLLQFEDSMVDICLKLLDMSHKHKQDPAKDASARRDPVYVGRVLSAMVGQAPAAGGRQTGLTPHVCLQDQQ